MALGLGLVEWRSTNPNLYPNPAPGRQWSAAPGSVVDRYVAARNWLGLGLELDMAMTRDVVRVREERGRCEGRGCEEGGRVALWGAGGLRWWSARTVWPAAKQVTKRLPMLAR